MAETLNEIDRIKKEYQRRANEQLYEKLYDVTNAANLLAIHSREQALMTLLKANDIHDLSQMRLLDIGCGNGSELLRWINYGCIPTHCAGIDLMEDRVIQAKQRLPSTVDIRQGDASCLPYLDASFDIISQFTVFSSMLDQNLQSLIAKEMLRVLKPNGIIIWYDFWWNPVNPHTRGIRQSSVKQLFPGCCFQSRLVTLAPPIARCVAPISSLLVHLLELLPLRTHWLISIRPNC